MLGKVDWELLVLLLALFVLNEAFQATGLIKQWVGGLSHYGIDLASNTWVFWLTSALSDTVSNVPAVMLLLPLVHSQSGGIAMALGSTLSSNLLITGSLANMIVLDAAAKENINISFLEFALAGIPVALLSLAFAFLWTLLGG